MRKNLKKMILLSSFVASISCSRIQTLNTEPHFYSAVADHILWIQIPGLSEEHLPLLKYNNQQSNYKTWFETIDCNGKAFSYNLYQLRPNAGKSFRSQMLGSKNIKNDCSDFDRPLAFKKFKKENYKISFLENGLSENDSITKIQTCLGESSEELNDIRLWKMTSSPYDKNLFHYQDSPEKIKNYLMPGVYVDKSCKDGVCYSSLLNNAKILIGAILKENQKTFTIVRDFSYLNALKQKDLSKTKERLSEIDQLLKWYSTQVSNKNLIIVTSGESVGMEFPLEGKEWEEYMKSGKNFNYKNTNLMSPVFAKGAGAENFCGIYDEAEISKRINFEVPAKKFNWDNVNPFN